MGAGAEPPDCVKEIDFGSMSDAAETNESIESGSNI